MKNIQKLLLFIGVALSVMVPGAWAEDYPKMKLRYANFGPEKMPNSKGDIFVVTELSRRTNGRVQVEIYHGGRWAK